MLHFGKFYYFIRYFKSRTLLTLLGTCTVKAIISGRQTACYRRPCLRFVSLRRAVVCHSKIVFTKGYTFSSFQMTVFERIQFLLSSTVILLPIYTIHAQKCFDDGNEFCIDENDILSVDLLPGSFLFADQQATKNTWTIFNNDTTDGSIYSALNEMKYHR